MKHIGNLHKCVSAFLKLVRERTQGKQGAALVGWDDAEKMPTEVLEKLLEGRLRDKNYVAVAGLCILLWNRQL